MERNTRSDIHDKITAIRKMYGVDIDVDFHSPAGKSLGQIKVLSTGNRLSMNLTIAELVEWLDGFCKALDLVGYIPLLNAANTLANMEQDRGSWPGECLECLTIVNDSYEKARAIILE